MLIVIAKRNIMDMCEPVLGISQVVSGHGRCSTSGCRYPVLDETIRNELEPRLVIDEYSVIMTDHSLHWQQGQELL